MTRLETIRFLILTFCEEIRIISGDDREGGVDSRQSDARRDVEVLERLGQQLSTLQQL